MPPIDATGGLTDESGNPVVLESRVQAELVRALVEQRGQWVSRDKLASRLWPRSDREKARGALRQTVVRLRKHLGAPEWLQIRRDAIRVLAKSDPTDEDDRAAFEALKILVSHFEGSDAGRSVRILAASFPLLSRIPGDEAQEILAPLVPHLRKSRSDDVALLIRYCRFLLYNPKDEEGYRLVRDAKAAAGALKRRPLTLEAHMLQGWFEYYRSRFSTALKTARQLCAGLTDEDELQARLRAHILLGTMTWEIEDIDEGAKILELVASEALSSGLLEEAGWALTNLGALYLYERRWTDFQRVWKLGAGIRSQVADLRIIDLTRLWESLSPLAFSKPKEALEALLRHEHEFIKLPLRLLLVRERETDLRIMLGDFQGAAKSLAEAESIRSSIGSRPSPYEKAMYQRFHSSVSSGLR